MVALAVEEVMCMAEDSRQEEEVVRELLERNDTELAGSPWSFDLTRDMLTEAVPDRNHTPVEREHRRFPRHIVDEDVLDLHGSPTLSDEMLTYIYAQGDPLRWMASVVRRSAKPAVSDTFTAWLRVQRRVGPVASVSLARREDLASQLEMDVRTLDARVEIAYNIIRLTVWARRHPEQAKTLLSGDD